MAAQRSTIGTDNPLIVFISTQINLVHNFSYYPKIIEKIEEQSKLLYHLVLAETANYPKGQGAYLTA